jgi:hypothetical protein
LVLPAWPQKTVRLVDAGVAELGAHDPSGREVLSIVELVSLCCGTIGRSDAPHVDVEFGPSGGAGLWLHNVRGVLATGVPRWAGRRLPYLWEDNHREGYCCDAQEQGRGSDYHGPMTRQDSPMLRRTGLAGVGIATGSGHLMPLA